jgi:hypothetical protein
LIEERMVGRGIDLAMEATDRRKEVGELGTARSTM